MQWAGGDDYELCFTLDAESRDRLPGIAEACAIEVSVIGEITSEAGLSVTGPDGRVLEAGGRGYRHFAEAAGAAK